ncbi:MAG: hypothetical protein FJ398_01770 [Verrucomicrobia bacterium]|nr:hypothetical protein [Verrucomicrobiota bacterium]
MIAIGVVNSQILWGTVKGIDRRRRGRDAIDASPFEVGIVQRRAEVTNARRQGADKFVKTERDFGQPSTVVREPWHVALLRPAFVAAERVANRAKAAGCDSSKSGPRISMARRASAAATAPCKRPMSQGEVVLASRTTCLEYAQIGSLGTGSPYPVHGKQVVLSAKPLRL